jgi:hypothetical protein
MRRRISPELAALRQAVLNEGTKPIIMSELYSRFHSYRLTVGECYRFGTSIVRETFAAYFQSERNHRNLLNFHART